MSWNFSLTLIVFIIFKEKKSSYSRDDCHVVQLLNSFIYKGPYGNHFCMVFEILGVNLLEVIKRYEYKGVIYIYRLSLNSLNSRFQCIFAEF